MVQDSDWLLLKNSIRLLSKFKPGDQTASITLRYNFFLRGPISFKLSIHNFLATVPINQEERALKRASGLKQTREAVTDLKNTFTVEFADEIERKLSAPQHSLLVEENNMKVFYKVCGYKRESVI